MRQTRTAFALAAATLLALALSGCGRKGPLELPPDVQARGDFVKAQQEADAKKRGVKPAPPPTSALAPGVLGPKEPQNIPGTIGNRPPSQYPFPLDPLL